MPPCPLPQLDMQAHTSHFQILQKKVLVFPLPPPLQMKLKMQNKTKIKIIKTTQCYTVNADRENDIQDTKPLHGKLVFLDLPEPSRV